MRSKRLVPLVTGGTGSDILTEVTAAEFVASQRRGAGNKYGAKRTTVDGITFDSKAEANRYSDLKLLERAGEISGLELQPVFPIVIDGIKVCDYRGDFAYRDREGNKIIEDTKGVRTPVYRLKRRLMLAVWGIDIKET